VSHPQQLNPKEGKKFHKTFTTLFDFTMVSLYPVCDTRSQFILVVLCAPSVSLPKRPTLYKYYSVFDVFFDLFFCVITKVIRQ
jgi:hypothetical protein